MTSNHVELFPIDVNFYRNDGHLLYSFSTLTINPKIVIGEHLEYNADGKIDVADIISMVQFLREWFKLLHYSYDKKKE